MMKQAIIVMSDPKSGFEEALGRVFNALAAAYDAKRAGDDVTLQFPGTGTRWAGELVNLESSVENREGSVCGGARQGTTTRNSCSIARSCNAAMCRHKRAVHPEDEGPNPEKALIFSTLNIANSGQLEILGSRRITRPTNCTRR